MSLAKHLYHRCTIQRAGDKKVPTFTQDSFGEEQPKNVTNGLWVTTQENLRCRLLRNSERRPQPTMSDQVETDYTLIIPAGIDVTTKDRVEEVRLEDGTVEGPFDIEAVIPRRDGKRSRLIGLQVDVID